uniref:Uncharacterized protein n=1 Tax=Arundo donax TaxID=35708 RepID=A0A0A9EKK7_ARUDO
MPCLAIAAKASLASRKPVRLASSFAEPVTTTLTPSSTHSLRSLHLNWKQAPQPAPSRKNSALAAAKMWPPLSSSVSMVRYPQAPASLRSAAAAAAGGKREAVTWRGHQSQ